MKRVVALITTLASVVAVLVLTTAAARSSDGPAADFVVAFEQVPPGLAKGDAYHGGRVKRVDREVGFAVVSASAGSGFEQRAQRDDRVRYVEADPTVPLLALEPSDPLYANQYAPQKVRANEAWDTSTGDLDSRVCVIDTGVRYTHEDLAGARWLGGFDFINFDNNPIDDHGHGTHVAGIAAGGVDNGLGIAGAANVGVYGVKALDQNGNGPWSAVASAIGWCVSNGGPRTVISMSLSGATGAQVVADAVAQAEAAGALIVAAAGNSGPCTNCVGYPAKYQEVVAVTCTTSTDAQCGFSSEGPEAEISAPGLGVLSSYFSSDSSYVSLSGTSMSTPLVSGAAALIWSQVPTLSNTQLRAILDANVVDLGPAGRDTDFGYGRLDMKAALDAALNGPPPTEVTVLDEDFDDGIANGWTWTGQWRVANNCVTAASAPRFMIFNRNQTCTYDTGLRVFGYARPPAMDLGGLSAATLSFSQRWAIESDAAVRDLMRVEVSTNGGATWSTLQQRDSTGEATSGWIAQSYDLSPYVGQAVMVRWYFDSVDGLDNGFSGWAIDDVLVTGTIPAGNQAPIAAAGPDATASDGDGSGSELVALDGSSSYDPDGTVASYEWSEAGLPLATVAAPVLDLGVGVHTITLTVTDDEGATDTDDVVVTVAGNQAPTATISSQVSELSVQVDGSGSTDSDGTITSWTWSWGDGSPTDSGPVASHTYAAPGAYTVSLTVVDDGGASNSTFQIVSVGGIPVTLLDEDFDDGVANGWIWTGQWRVANNCVTAASPPRFMIFNRNQTCTYATGVRVQGYTRPPALDLGALSSATLSFSQRWAIESDPAVRDLMRVEASTNGGATWAVLEQRDSTGPSVSGWVNQAYDLSAFIGQEILVRWYFDSIDGIDNAFSGWAIDDVVVSGTIPAGNQAPVADAGADQSAPDGDGNGVESVTLDGSASFDPDGTIDSHSWTEAGNPVATGANPTIDLAVGTHTLTLTVIDNEGATDTDVVVVTVLPNQPPVAVMTSAVDGLGVQVDGSGSSDADGAVQSWTWDWGDGSPTDSGTTASHTYAAPGSYSVTLTVVDDGGSSAATIRVVSVGGSPVTLLDEDFDDGVANGWTWTGQWRVANSCVTAASPPRFMIFNRNQTCTYDTAKRVFGYARPAAIDLAGLTSATLSFAHRWSIESDPAVRDVMRVELSTDGGASWSALQQWDSTGAADSGWVTQVYDLTAYVGQSISVRWTFDTIDALDNAFTGWALDDVVVAGLVP